MVGYLPDNVRIDHVGFGVVLGEDKYGCYVIKQYFIVNTCTEKNLKHVLVIL